MPRASSSPSVRVRRIGTRLGSGIAAALVWAAAAGAAAQTGVPRQAVVETSLGTFIIDLTPEVAPNQVAYFIKTAQEGGYDGTTFHRLVKYGMVQGGDPLTKDPAKRAQYGTGGLNAVQAEPRAGKMTRGSVAAVLIPNRPDSAGTQFFVVIVDQPSLDNQYTVFGRIAEGMEVVQKISETPTDAAGLATERVTIAHVTIRDTPPPAPVPFSTESVAELAQYRVALETSAGRVVLEMLPDKAPSTVRQFLRLVQSGVYDGTSVHRVVPGFVIQTGSLDTRQAPLTAKQQELVRELPPEFNDTKHVKGVVSMARGNDPGSATTSFFICTGTAETLDGKYTAFARVVEGMSVVEAIESVPRTNEAPITRVELRAARVETR